jgi:hypothetical protein
MPMCLVTNVAFLAASLFCLRLRMQAPWNMCVCVCVRVCVYAWMRRHEGGFARHSSIVLCGYVRKLHAI